MTVDVEKEAFVSGQFRAGPGYSSDAPQSVMRRARTQLWKTFRGTKMRAGAWRLQDMLSLHVNHDMSASISYFPTLDI